MIKKFSEFISESPIRAMSVDRKLLYNKNLYVGGEHSGTGGVIYHPVMKYKNMSNEPEETVATVIDKGGKKMITYVGKWNHIQPAIVDDWTDVLDQVKKDTKL